MKLYDKTDRELENYIVDEFVEMFVAAGIRSAWSNGVRHQAEVMHTRDPQMRAHQHRRRDEILIQFKLMRADELNALRSSSSGSPKGITTRQYGPGSGDAP